jgi:arylsulfatase A-like enzyme
MICIHSVWPTRPVAPHSPRGHAVNGYRIFAVRRRLSAILWGKAVACGWLAATAAAVATARADDRRPNIVLIMTDNHGPWTLGCYGNRDIRTPNIDRLAKEGIRFTQAFSSNAVCSPTRATFLTGLIPSQHGVHCFLSAGEPQTGPQAYSTIDEFRSLGEILRDAGYVCGLSGKWHLGKNLKPQEGFDDLWITKPHGSSNEFYDQEVIENGAIRNEPQDLTDLWTDRGVEFIERNRERPFFLFLAYNGPYGLGKLLLNDARNRHREFYADKQLPSFPREEADPRLFNNREYLNNPVSIRRYAAEISGIDDGVGRIVDTLAKHDLERRTIVIFTADQGLAGGQGGFWGMGDHTRPMTAYDWTMHIPLIVRHPGGIPAGRTSGALVSNYDFLPSLVAYLGLTKQEQARADFGASLGRSPGRDFSAMLRGDTMGDWDDAVYFEFETVRSVRTREAKLVLRHPDGPDELYDLRADPGEKKNLYESPGHAGIREALRKQLVAFFEKNVDPQYDLWKNGRSKAKLHHKR